MDSAFECEPKSYMLLTVSQTC